ncbi:MAG: 4Fe-4S dicluster domain-containing protein [Candidatus Rokubacteria bacterium]|nr:4Fe-4S dicluster domain-containing protein [Candidatus Rokubacteria bacterium]
MAIALLQDMSRCVGCKACQVACKAWNELPAVPTSNAGGYENPRALSAATWTYVQFAEDERNGQPDWRFFKTQCMHCANAACVEVCPTGALYRHASGFVALERDRCNGCGYCATFCPYGVPQMETESRLTGRAKVAKCTFCEDRVTNGLSPACAKACPAGVIAFGDREALLERGRVRVAELRREGRSDATLYGEHELGGLGVLYVLPESPARYRALPADPDGTWRVATGWQRYLQPLGAAGLLLGAAGLIVNYLSVRRARSRPTDGGSHE